MFEGRQRRGKITLKGDSRSFVRWAWIAFDIAVIEKGWCRDVDVDDTAYGAGVTIEGQVKAVVVGRKKNRICAGVLVVAGGFLMCELLHVGSIGTASVLVNVLDGVNSLKS
jgi:hypothetical protein